MALFGSKKKKEEAPAVEKKAPAKKPRAKKADKAETKEVAVATPVRASSNADVTGVIYRPRITEKASMKAEANVYTFEVAVNANKATIAEAVRQLYNVVPARVAIVTIPAKQVFVRGKRGVSKGGKKAYVYLKKGETIEFV